MEKNRKTLLICVGIFSFMVVLSYASVPLYDLFCRTTGFGGTTKEALVAPTKILDRKVKITFLSETDQDLPWNFKPEQTNTTIRLGETGLAFYSAENTASEDITGMAIYNVTPDKAGKYFNKIACFCFDQQHLKANQKMMMPVTFFIDPAMDNDPALKDVEEITLNYTFFRQ